MILIPDPWWLPAILAAALLFDAVASIRPPKFIRDCLDGVGFPRDWWWALIVIKMLATAGWLLESGCRGSLSRRTSASWSTSSPLPSRTSGHDSPVNLSG